MTPAPPSRSRSGETRRERRSRETRALLRALLKRWSMSRGDHELASSELSPVVGPASSILSDTSSRRNSRLLSSGQSSQVPHYLPAGRGVLSLDPTAGTHQARVGVKIDHGPAALWQEFPPFGCKPSRGRREMSLVG